MRFTKFCAEVATAEKVQKMFKLRPYQVDASQSAIDWVKRCVEPCVLDLATGAGKSLIIAEVAAWVSEKTGKRVLCLAPSKELVEQNHEKYEAYGNPASIYSASIGKSLRHPVVFGTPQSVKNSLRRFSSGEYGMVIVDECHGITPTIRTIIASMKKANPRLRVVGLSATPYRMNTGYIYGFDVDGTPIDQSKTIEPYFNSCIYRLTASELIEQGYLTPAHADPEHAASYDTSALTLNRRGQFDAAAIDRAFVGHGRKTSDIVSDIVGHASNRLGVMIFAATVQHAMEIMASLPENLSAIVTGETPKETRGSIIRRFKAMEIKYLVNVSVLTTGFDAPHVDMVAVMRKTESASLFQQIVGRGLRLSPDTNKTDCLVLDYAENIEFHQLEDDLFDPSVRAKPTSKSTSGNFNCPVCKASNTFTMRINPDEFEINSEGYFVDLEGLVVETDGGVPIPGHHGRRCNGQTLDGKTGEMERCHHRWSSKECPECEHENDIAARFCEKCKFELVDPNEKLKENFHRLKADPYSISTDAIVAFKAQKWIGKTGNESVRCDYKTQYSSFAIWYTPKMKKQWESISVACYGKIAPTVDLFVDYLHKSKQPETITAYKDQTSKFYRAIAHNRPVDEIPD